MPTPLGPGTQATGTTREIPVGAGGLARRSVLPGGLRVLSEVVPSVRSVALGVWVQVGSVDENRRQAGSAHFLEHLLFKGTRRRSALEISASIEAVGGEMNAFTAKEYTCFYARVLDDDLPLAVDVLCDMIASSVVSRADVDSERNVVLEEIAMRDDDPSDAVHDLFSAAVLGDTPLGRPVIGTVESVTGMSRPGVHGFYRSRYVAPAIVVTAAGNVDHPALVAAVGEAFGEAGLLADVDAAPLASRGLLSLPAYRPGRTCLERPNEQANVVVGGRGLSRHDERRFALGVLNAAVGGGMSSRLFQEIRERRGLAYSVYSFASQQSGAGVFGVYAGCQPSRAGQVIEIVREQLAEVAAHGLTDQELDRGKGQMRGNLVLGLEDTGSRMSRLGKSEIAYGELLTLDEVLARIDAVTPDDIREVAALVLTQPLSLAAIGPCDTDDLTRAVA